MIGLKAKKASLFDAPMKMEEPAPQVTITYAENGFIVSCNHTEKYIAKTLKDAFQVAKDHFGKMVTDEEKEDKKDSKDKD
jgi:hypothetical protein